MINRIGEGRQLFKAEVRPDLRKTPFDYSFCTKAVPEEEFLIILDATKDARFQSNALVTAEPGLRFYAGALLKIADGCAIGTICVLDYRPRSLTEVQQTTLRVLARQVMRQIELRRVIRERDAAQAQQVMVQAIASQTLRGVTEKDAVNAFCSRLAALGLPMTNC